jgi:hypothetical protein
MARRVLLAAGVLSLILVGTTWGTARADDSAIGHSAEPGVLQLFGKTFCFASAPADVQCDWRAPGSSERPRDTDFFERVLDLGDFLAVESKPDRKSSIVRLLGLTLCIGEPPEGSICHATFPAQPEQSDQRASF